MINSNTMENSYLPYGQFIPTPAMVYHFQTFGISGYHHPLMPNSFFQSGQHAFPPNTYFQGPPTTTNLPLPSMNLGLNAGT
jgi:hypothetical protein